MLSEDIQQGMSILIPTWNNLPYVQKCIESIRKYSSFEHQIILHINEGRDWTAEWAVKEGITYTHSQQNLGVCRAMNHAVCLALKPLIGYFNDDMVALPEWDKELYDFAEKHKLSKNTVLSSTMIEPIGDNPCCVAPLDFGRDLLHFDEQGLIDFLPHVKNNRHAVKGSTWPPNFIHRELWDKVGGYSEEFSPGFGSDPDLAKKLYDIGVRDFISVGRSLVYHFGCKTTKTKKFIHNNGEAQFFQKYGININDFAYGILHRGEPYEDTSINS